jgi:hypothetical protein
LHTILTHTTLSAAGSIIATDHEGVAHVYHQGDLAWILTSMALIWIMIPGVGFFYSGLLRRKNALSMIYLSIMAITVVSFQVSSSFIPSGDRKSLTISSSVVLLGILLSIQ